MVWYCMCFFLAGWMQSMSEAYSQTMCRTWTQIATTGAVTSFGEKRYGYRKCGSDIFTFLENTKKHMESAEKRMVFAQDRFATNGLVRWQNMLVEATDGGEGEEGGQQLWKLPSWFSRSIW